jgi:hypothetical protein
LPTSAKAGSTNTGGGGGGAGADPTNLNYGGRGGSGIVLFRYAGTANLTNLSNVSIVSGYVYHAINSSTVVYFYTDIGRGGVGGPYGGGGGGANGWINSIGGGGGASGSALLTGNTGGYGGGGGGGSSATVASGGGGGVDIWGLGRGGTGGAANANGSGGSGNLTLNTSSLGGLPGFNGNGGLFGGGGSGGNVASVDNTRGWGAGGAFVILYSTSASYTYPNPSPVNSYTNTSGIMLNSNASTVTQGTIPRAINSDSGALISSAVLQPGSVATRAGSQVLLADLSQDINSNHISGYIDQYAVGVTFPYYDLVSTPNIYNTANYSPTTVLNQTVAYEPSQRTISPQRYFVPNSANVNSVTNNRAPQQIITVNTQPEFMLVNSDKNYVASNTAPTNYQSIQAVTNDNDPRLASLRVGFAVKGQTGTNPYNPQNVY